MMTKIAKIAGLLAIAISTSACVSSNKASQDAMTMARPLIYAEPVSQKFDQAYEQVAQLQISRQGAAGLLAMSNLPVATEGATQVGETQKVRA